ncbi:cobalamin (vitamin B12) biosynthesis CbiM protein [Methanocaldococcus infernus ME]|uniref:Cobalamin (Vitamin B12) biosynthesis CbiM protein n=1 Tax=Methanocaldococcus infernus (strain DSM 11812 / JCM 15783 / ME) TaxID=573063 RepID=D5VQX8_METIM|nr:cobalt transporter CbiM [Methanocaldococcus infernus]ADG12981.1 cobalamin (vitamin B12) biosynthesis CbiM protein [Methanocaldococcus infernus ME]
MHIPDGYLGPITCAFFYLIMIPFWYKGIKELKKLDPRKLPLLGVLTAFSFLVMMFNLPVPDGTTCHMVGGTLIAVLMDNPWIATIAISIVLVIQAIFFGDGGITCIGANCFNMGVVLPFVGYYVYKALKDKIGEPVAAGIGAYIGLVAAAIVAGFEFGLQPFIEPGYCPYPFTVSVPAMALAHILVAGPVAAIVTGLVVWYVKKSYSHLYATSSTN